MAEQLELLIAVKAYPAVSRKYGESVCVAGIQMTGEGPSWIRLFPVQYRDLEWSQRFRKYQLVTLKVTPPGSDKRPESRKPILDSLELGKVITTDRNWAKRRPWVEPLMRESMCEIQQRQRETGESLGVFRPREVLDFEWEIAEGEWSPGQLAILQQSSFLGPAKSELERIPYRFRYRYKCEASDCRGHFQSIIDWELGEAFRVWRQRYGEASALERLRDKWLGEIFAPDRDAALFVGNQHLHPESFLVLGTFWPRAD